MIRGLFRGLLAGAAGATALNAVTYGDMVYRGRGTSDTPERTVEALADQFDYDIPGKGDERDNRVSGLGALSGIGTGVAVGGAYGALGAARWRIPGWLGATLIGATAMAVTDLTMAKLGVSDPSEWSTADWISDAVPHLAFGVVTWTALRSRRFHA